MSQTDPAQAVAVTGSRAVIIALVAWIGWAVFYRPLATVANQNASEYAALCRRYSDLDSNLASWCPSRSRPADVAADPNKAFMDSAYCKIQACKKEIAEQLGITATPSAGLRWVLATGYISLWTLVHDAEEDLIELAPGHALLEWADLDRLRIQDSTIPNSDRLLQTLKWGLTGLSSTSAAFISQPLPDGVAGQASETEVRASLRSVRNALNDFRDSAWDGLVRQRNHLIERVVYTRISTFLLLGLAIVAGVPLHTIFSVAVFFLVGAGFGYIAQLAAAPLTDPPVEDYGLSSVTLLQTTLFSGFAGVAGVAIIGLTTDVLSGNLGKQPPSHLVLSNLSDIFDVSKHQLELVVAAIFGWTPQLLLNRLQQLASQYKLAIGCSEPTGSATGNATASGTGRQTKATSAVQR